MNRGKVKNQNNHQSESDESNNSLQVNQLDLSLIRKPVKTSVEGFEEVLRAYESGTSELKKLLSKECDLIYECKVCRNIFRSLTNFISHKRVYCRSSFNSANHFHFNSNGFNVQDISTIIQAEQKSSHNDHPKGANSNHTGGTEEKSKDISGIVEQLLWKQHQSRNTNVDEFYSQIQTSSNQDEQPEAKRKKQTLMLNRVNNSDVAVFQSIMTENDQGNMKDEINEVHNLLSKNNTVLGPDGKVLNLFNAHTRTDSPMSEASSDVILACQVCNLQFETKKMLKVHVEMKHLPGSYVYQCPSCTQKFSSSAAVIRHLSNDHKKSNRRIRLMRDSIINKRMRADEVSTKSPPGTSREVQKLQKQANGIDNSTAEWTEIDLKGGGSLDDSYTCPSCLKKFERKAVYTSHVQMCSDIKDREIEKMKKRKAKDETKMMKNSMEIEENSNISEDQRAGDSTSSKRKRKRTSKVKNDETAESLQDDSSDMVDWNLDDEEETKKIEVIKKEIIADEYKKIEVKIEVPDLQQFSDDEDSGLIIDEKTDIKEEVASGNFKCPQCEKTFESDEKLKTHLTCYHSRQKRFRCKICDYQGYRKKDTLNHLNFVHNAGVAMAQLFEFVETVNKAVDEAEIAKQKEIKRGQTKLKRQLARQMQRKKVKEEGETSEFATPLEVPQVLGLQPTSVAPQIPTVTPPMQISPTKSEHKSISSDGDDEEDDFDSHRRKSSRACKNTSSDVSPAGESNQRPIRTRVKPVNKDFLYDLSDLLKKEQEAHREQITTNITGKRELRKRAMSTHVRETFESPTKTDAPPQFLLPTKSSNDSLAVVRNRRMSVFVPSSRPTFNPPPILPRTPPKKSLSTHKNAGMALKMATKAYEQNKASLFEPKFNEIPNYRPTSIAQTFAATSTPVSSGLSAASSILQKLTGGAGFTPKTSLLISPPKCDEKSKMTPEQLCKKFEHFNVTNELDIPKTNAISLNTQGGNSTLMALALGEAKNDVCVLQECSADSTDFNAEDSDSEPRLEIHSEKVVKKGRGRPRKNAGKSPKGQSRLTVMQRLQENKIKKSRDQIFQRLMKRQSEEDDDDEEDPDYDFEGE